MEIRYVTHEITVKVAQRLQETVLRCYHRDIRWLKRRLTFKGVDTIIARAESKIYPIAYGGHGEIYNHPDELLNDLFEAREVLITHHKGLFQNLLDEFILKVKIFGFSFASMDIRQDSRKHAYAWEAILEKLQTKNKKLKTFDALTEHQKIDTLLNLNFKPSSMKFEDQFITELIESIGVIGQIQAQNGQEGCHRYVISNCQSALDIIRVYQLAKLILGKDDVLPLDIVPLFETIEDLANAEKVMNEIYSIPAYRDHLKSRGNKQTIMLGFSDGTKDGGYLRANWSIFNAKEKLTEISARMDSVQSSLTAVAVLRRVAVEIPTTSTHPWVIRLKTKKCK